MMSSNNITRAIDSNKQIYQKMQVAQGPSNRAMMLNAHHSDQIQYYNDEKAKKQADRKKKNKIITLSFVGLSSVAIAAGVVISLIKGKNKHHINMSKLKNMNLDPKKFGFDPEKIKQSKFVTAISEKLKPVFSAGINIGTLRDDFARRAVEKTKGTKFNFIHTGAEALRAQYHKWAKAGAKGNFETARNNLLEVLAKQGVKLDIGDFDSFFSEVQETTTRRLAQSKTTITQEFFAKGKNGKMRSLAEMGKELISEPIANRRIKDIYEKYLIGDVIPKEVLEKPEVRKALMDYNNIIGDVIDKHRDTNLGNAISDAAGMLVALGGLGAAVVTADDKEERKSTVLNLGIPILSTLGFMVYGNMKNIAGAKSMVIGFALGEVTKIFAKLIDKITTPKKKEATQVQQ